ncbi:type VI secretion system baseplate subunit TssF [Ciceribacter sp. L1K23]|uniref:type VI secretion system baseplate subunit TssF n=1 Tax=Ciceribacter sp. L1K23 TaxID=2820276 RepID=UPI001B8287F4|nr:type VI secretion system baseplate subunit TssF [Ciceribacter sp. L1K23]MBR0558410.1 type VI secretion system baseplate subunit TssF [Ciceribacter sp. L1K23]
MAINTYYRDELSYLREMGALFAKANPRLARHLGRDSTDPDVERLLEGMAFMVGRLRQRLDAEMPELALSLLQLVWPHYLRPVPPITVLGFRFAEGASGTSIEVPRGTRVQSRPIDGDAVPFSTSYDTTVLPFEMTAAELDNRKNSSRLTLTIRRVAGSGLQPLAVAPLTLFLNSVKDVAMARQLYLFLLERRRTVTVSTPGRQPEAIDLRIEPMGFLPSEAVLPYPEGSFDGFRVMQEYFSCPEKFMFLRIRGLEALSERAADSFSLSFELGQPFPDTSRIGAEVFVLNATPAVNLLETEGRALTVSHERSEYPVRPVGDAGHFSVHTVESVEGWVQGSGRRVAYEPFESFRHDVQEDGVRKLYFRTQVRPALLGNGIDHHLSFVTRLGKVGLPETETISMKLMCSNGALATRLGVGSIDQPTSTTPAKLAFENITPVLAEVPPPIDDDVLWTLIANLARNFSSMIDVEALRTVVGAYDFRARTDRQAALQRDTLLQSFKTFERRGVDVITHGRPVRGFELALSVSEGMMGGEGEMYLFGTILDRFLKSYSSINSLHRFSMIGLDTNIVFRWAAKWGEAATL